jgi:hypothetical protein
MTIAHIQQRQNAMSRIPQTNYATATAPNTGGSLNFVEVPLKDQNFANKTVQTQDNRGYATRNDFPTDQWLLSHDVERAIEYDVDTDTLGRMLYLALGSVVTTTPNAVGAPTARQHVFKPQDPNVSRQLPATTWVEQVGAALNRLFPSCVCDNFNIRGEGIQRIMSAFSLRGSGKEVEPSGVVFATDGTNNVRPATGLKYLFNSQVEVTVADAGTLSNAVNYGATKRLESWGLSYQNTPLGDIGYRPGSTDFQTAGDVESGAIRSECLFGDRSIVPEFVARLDSTSNERAAMRSQKSLDWRALLTGPVIGGAAALHHSLSIRTRINRYSAVDLGNQGGILTVAVRPTALWDLTTAEILEIILVNETTSYTA